MADTNYFGLVSAAKDEKPIIKGLNSFLATLNRTTSKSTSKSMLKSYLPFEFKHYYWNLNKGTGTYLAIFPNCDQRGEWVYERNKDCAWFAQAIFHRDFPGFDDDASPSFIRKALEATGCEVVSLVRNPVFDSSD